MQTRSAFYSTVLVGTAFLGAGCATNQPVQQPISPPPIVVQTSWMKNARITAVSVNETDESKLLGLYMWRFDIVAPKPKHQINFVVEAQEMGIPPRTLVSLPMDTGSGWPLNKKLSVFVGQSPLYDGQVLGAKANYQLRFDSFQSKTLEQIGGSSTSSVANNPLSGIASTGSSGSPNQRPDGSFVLSYGYRNGFPTQPQQTPDVALVFRVEEQAY